MTRDAKRYALIHEILGGARCLSGERLSAYLETACPGDPSVRAEVEELLALAEDRNDLLAESRIVEARQALASVVEHALEKKAVHQEGEDEPSERTDAPPDWLPSAIGGYSILRLIGRGGMGIVYEAEQESTKRRVAIKLLHPMLATPDSMRRFRNEVRTLGRLRHPGIAQIYESGMYDAGRGPQPFFAMELVDGLDVLTHVERNNLDRPGRLTLLAQVADAVQYAHDQKVIHRDLKPDNVLVDEFGQPRVLDFGIARVRGASETLSTIVTGEGHLLGTLAYMAPEQLEGTTNAITNQVDVYALGVLGFQLLIGRLPREIADLPLSQAITLLARGQPPRASSFDPAFKGDLDTIFAKALESDPGRRYATAAELAGDQRRHLDHQPIRAKPPSRVYLARKFARRHRGLVAGTLAAVFALVVGLIVSLYFADAAREQRDLARRNEMRAVNGLLQSAQTLVEANRESDAVEQLWLVPEEDRGFAWRLLDRATPFVVDIDFASGSFIDDEHIVGVPYAGPNRELGSALVVYSLLTRRTIRTLFEGELIATIFSSDAAGQVITSTVNQVQRSGRVNVDYLHLDLENDTILGRWPIPFLTDDVELPGGRQWISPPAGPESRRRIGEVSSDGGTLLHYVDPRTAVVYADGEAVWTVDDLGMWEAAHIGRDGRFLVINRDDEVVAYDIETRELLFRYPFGPADWASGLPVHGGLLLQSYPDNPDRSTWPCPRAWRRFDLTAGPFPLTPQAPFEGAFHSPDERDPSVSFSLDGHSIAIGNIWPNQGVRMADATTGLPMDSEPFTTRSDGLSGWLPLRGAFAPSVSPNGKRVLLVGPTDGTHVYELDPRSGVEGFDPRFVRLAGHTDAAGSPGSGWVYQVTVSHDGSLVASIAPMDPFVRVWDARTGECIAKLERTGSSNPGEGEELLAFAADDERVVAGMWLDHDATIRSWNLRSQAQTNRVATSDDSGGNYAQQMLDAFIIELAPEGRARLSQRAQMLSGRALATSYFLRRRLNGTDYEWPLPSQGERWINVPGPDGRGTGLSVHPEAPRLAVVQQIAAGGSVVARSGKLLILDADSFEPLIHSELSFVPWCVAYSPDGAFIAIGTGEGRVLLFETEQMTQRLEFQAHDSYVFSIAWTPDGTRLVTASGDETIKLWDSRTRPASRLEYERWIALREELSERDDLLELYASLAGEERQAARIELIRRARGEQD